MIAGNNIISDIDSSAKPIPDAAFAAHANQAVGYDTARCAR
jgi:hypothetical protein